MQLKTIDVIFIILFLIFCSEIFILMSMDIGPLLKGIYNKYTLLHLGIFIPALLLSAYHLYTVFAESKKVTKSMVYTIIGYVIVFPIAYGLVVILGAVFLH